MNCPARREPYFCVPSPSPLFNPDHEPSTPSSSSHPNHESHWITEAQSWCLLTCVAMELSVHGYLHHSLFYGPIKAALSCSCKLVLQTSPFGWLVGQLIDWSVTWSLSLSVGRSVGRSVGQSVSWFVNLCCWPDLTHASSE